MKPYKLTGSFKIEGALFINYGLNQGCTVTRSSNEISMLNTACSYVHVSSRYCTVPKILYVVSLSEYMCTC